MLAVEGITGPREAYMLIENINDNAESVPGTTGILEFMKGGPTGGYWKFTAGRPATKEGETR